MDLKILGIIVAGIIVAATVPLAMNNYDNNNINNNALAVKGIWTIQVYDENGNIIDERVVENVITKQGLDLLLTSALSATSSEGMSESDDAIRLAVGDCGSDSICNPPSVNNTALENQIRWVNRIGTPAVSDGQTAGTKVVVQQFVIGNTPVAETYREAGLLPIIMKNYSIE